MNRILIPVLAALFYIPTALADEVQSQSAPTAALTPSLSPTQQWLAVQRSGKSASAHAQPVSGEVMDKVHTRYLKSFEKPIPEFFEHEMRTGR